MVFITSPGQTEEDYDSKSNDQAARDSVGPSHRGWADPFAKDTGRDAQGKPPERRCCKHTRHQCACRGVACALPDMPQYRKYRNEEQGRDGVQKSKKENRGIAADISHTPHRCDALRRNQQENPCPQVTDEQSAAEAKPELVFS